MKDIIATDYVPSPSSFLLRREHARFVKWVNNKVGANINPIELIELLYSITAKFMRAPTKSATCSKGCYHCCNVYVGVTGLEAYYIHQKTGAPIDFKVGKPPVYDSKPWCPFLKNGECSIYEWRPMACRTFLSFDDPYLCETNQSHRLFVVTEQGKGGNELLNWMYVKTAEISTQEPLLAVIKDIREFFKLPPGTTR